MNTSNPNLKNKAWLELASIALKTKDYKTVRNCYDSLNFNDPLLTNIDKLKANQDLYGRIADDIEVVERQDSVQKIAAMPEDERKDFVKKLARQIRKEQGLKEEPGILVPIGNNPQQQQQQTDLFNTSSKGEWYFYNAALRIKGQSEFKSKWGNRANADNWRRLAAVGLTQNQNSKITTQTATRTDRTIPVSPTGEVDFETLYEKLPLTEELMKISNDSLSTALYMLGKSMTDEIEDCSSSIEAFEKLRLKFPDYEKMDEVLFSLYYCYNKNGETGKANSIKKIMEQKYTESPLTSIVSTGKDPRSKTNNSEATKTYENIYNLFIEGKFEDAISQKEKADVAYGSNFWTPQLLYIEAVYYIKQKEDNKATTSLSKIVTGFPNTTMAEKASKMIEVLSRRKEIEDELTKLDIKRPVEITPKKPITDTIAAIVSDKKRDSLIQQPKQLPAQPVTVAPVVIKKDSIADKPVITPYVYKADDKYSVLVLLQKTDLVWTNEAKNAYNIYNKNKFFNRQFEMTLEVINDDTKALKIGSFDNAQDALDYLHTIKPASPSQIIPWLTADRYSFTIISSGNFEILKSVKDINIYKQFIEKNLPGKF